MGKNEQLPSWCGQKQLYLSLLGKYCSSQPRILIRRACLSEGYNAALRTVPFRAGVHAPTKSVSAPAAISVVLIFHVIFMARTTADQ